MDTSARGHASGADAEGGYLLNSLRHALAALESSWVSTCRFSSVAKTLTLADDGVFLGASKLAPNVRGYQRQIHILTSYFAGAVAPEAFLPTLERAEDDYRAGRKALSAMRLALAFPTPSADAENCRKLHVAAGLIYKGFLSAGDLLVMINAPDHDSVFKYSPDQPRVPAGNSDGGQWAQGDSGASQSDQQEPRLADGCEEEWKWAIGYCTQLLEMPNPPRSLTGGHTTVRGCAKGFVSERCGGNKV